MEKNTRIFKTGVRQNFEIWAVTWSENKKIILEEVVGWKILIIQI